MKEFSRLAVGVLLLGLAIYLSLNFDEQSVSEKPEESQSPTSEDAAQPEWQAPPAAANWFAGATQDDSIVRPKFDTESSQLYARPLNPEPEVAASLPQPPQISDRYHPAQRLMVTGQVNRGSNLVPVQPKPTFTGSISLVRQIHMIREGDTLQSIAREYFGSANRYLDIYLLNKDVLSNPARLPSGVEIRIPGAN